MPGCSSSIVLGCVAAGLNPASAMQALGYCHQSADRAHSPHRGVMVERDLQNRPCLKEFRVSVCMA